MNKSMILSSSLWYSVMATPQKLIQSLSLVYLLYFYFSFSFF